LSILVEQLSKKHLTRPDEASENIDLVELRSMPLELLRWSAYFLRTIYWKRFCRFKYRG